eukprot:94755-Amphidinium_carterae.1
MGQRHRAGAPIHEGSVLRYYIGDARKDFLTESLLGSAICSPLCDKPQFVQGYLTRLYARVFGGFS